MRPSLENHDRPGSGPKRVAIYTRISTSRGLEQEFSSIDAQREACEHYVQSQVSMGWALVAAEYSDGGFTGGNTDRPAYRRLMRDVECGKIDVVVVYKVDRLSRSLLDFGKMMDRFSRCGTAFVSVTQHFSTADAMGRFTLNILMSFAEFEREMISERTRDKIAAARRRGRWTGGSPPFGYTSCDRKLSVVAEDAEVIREIFRGYLDGQSMVGIADALNASHRLTKGRMRNGVRLPGQAWSKKSVMRILRNPIYAGWMSYEGVRHEGIHEAIVSRETFAQVERLRRKNRPCQPGARSHSRPRGEYLLSKRIFCSCGSAMTSKGSQKRNHGQAVKYRYYGCIAREKRGVASCPSRPLPAAALEDFVIEHVHEAIARGPFDVAVRERIEAEESRMRGALEQERLSLSAKVAQIAAELHTLVNSLVTVNMGARGAMMDRISALGEESLVREKRLAEVEQTLRSFETQRSDLEWVQSMLSDFETVWNAMVQADRFRFMQAVVRRVVVDEPHNTIEVTFHDFVGSAMNGAEEAGSH